MTKPAILLTLLLCTLGATAQQKWAKTASKAVFTLKTFAADGSMIADAQGFFIDEAGTAVSPYSPFHKAARATIIDATGKAADVDCILGADDTYDVVKFHVQSKRTTPLALAATPASTDDAVYLLPYSTAKAPRTIDAAIKKVEPAQTDYQYYTAATTAADYAAGTPMLNAAGEALGLMTAPAAAGQTAEAYAVDTRLAAKLSVTALTLNSPALRGIGIRKALPDDEEQAVLALYLTSGSADSLMFAAMTDDFIQKFPRRNDGYVYRAQALASAEHLAEAADNLERAIAQCDKKDDTYFNFAKLIYAYVSDKQESAPVWTLDNAVDKAEKAYSISPVYVYRLYAAQVRTAQKRYAEALDICTSLIASGERRPEIFSQAASCNTALGDTLAAVALLDSAVATFGKPYPAAAAPYLLARADQYLATKQYRHAAADLNDYEKLSTQPLSDAFFYLRAQAEQNGRLFQQALNDLQRATVLAPKNTLYLAEKAALEVKVGLYDEAAVTARQCIDSDPQATDGWLFLGYAQCLAGNKKEGIANLRKASELGDKQADKLIQKFQ